MDHINDAMNKTIGHEKRMTTSQTVLKGKVKQSIVCAPVRISLHSTVVSIIYSVELFYLMNSDTTRGRRYISYIS